MMTTYYCSSLHGNDHASGTSPDQPLLTLHALNALTLKPADEIRLERGSVWHAQALHPHGTGSAEHPLIISDYGDSSAPMPAIHADGTGIWYEDYRAPIGGSVTHPHRNHDNVSSALLLMDVPYVEVSNLEISNQRVEAEGHELPAFNDPDAMNRTGVAVIAQDGGTITHTVLEHLYIHDVDGNVYDKHMANGGIYVIAHLPSNVTNANDAAIADAPINRFDDVVIRHNRVERTTRWGIAVGYTAYLNVIDCAGTDEHGNWNNTFDYGDGTIADDVIAHYGATNVRIEHNTVDDAGGDAITTMYCDRPIIRSNTSHRAARFICTDIYTATEADRVAAAIWPWRCKNALFEYNMAFDTLHAQHGNGDGQAWDADYGDGTVYRHNYSRHNSGGTVMFCNEKAVNSVFEYNTADHDELGCIDIPRNPDACVRCNTFIIGADGKPLREARADGVADVSRNTFINDGCVEPIDWHPDGSVVTYANNTFIGFVSTPETDIHSDNNAGDQVCGNDSAALSHMKQTAATIRYVRYDS